MVTNRCAYRSGYGGPRCLRRATKSGYCRAHGRSKLATCPACYGEGKRWLDSPYEGGWVPCSCDRGLVVARPF